MPDEAGLTGDKTMRTVKAVTTLGNKCRLYDATVESDGTILIYDDVAKHFTTCHSIASNEAKEIRADFVEMLADLLLDQIPGAWDTPDFELLRSLVPDESEADFADITHFFYGTYNCSEETARLRAVKALEMIKEETTKEND